MVSELEIAKELKESIKYNTGSVRCEKIGIHLETCKRWKEFLENITYGCNKSIQNSDFCGDLTFSNKIILCENCREHYLIIQNKIKDLNLAIKEEEGK